MSPEEMEPLLLEKSYRKNADRIQGAVEADPEILLPYLTERFLSGRLEGGLITSMAWGNLARARPAWMQDYQERLYRASVFNAFPGIRRNVIRYFAEIPVLIEEDHLLPAGAKRKDFLYCRSSQVEHQKNGPNYVEPELEGLLLDHVISIIANPQEVVVPKAFGMQLATNLALKYPEIANELQPVVRQAMQYGTSGVKHRGKVALKLLSQLNPT